MRGTGAAAILVLAALSGCLASIGGDEGPATTVLSDGPVARVTDTWYDADGVPNTHFHEAGKHAPFHTLEDIEAKIMAWQAQHPDLVRVDVIGESIEGRPMWDVVVTDRRVPGPKPTPIIDGGHHANELGGIELALHTVDFLLQNHAGNATVRGWIETLEIHVVPLVNPDGYVVQTRGNALGVNLNRNYDIDWGNPLGASNPVMGTIAHASGQAVPSVIIVAENCGSGPFSEPESSAMRDLFTRLAPTAAFYMTGHTPTHAVIAPWGAYERPFEMPADHGAVLAAELDWIRSNTEYEAGTSGWGDLSAGLPYAASGSSMDYFYAVVGKPAFTVEVEFYYTSATSPTWPVQAVSQYEGLRYWMDATIPIPLHLLANAHLLKDWRMPEAQAPVPEGSVPTPPAWRAFWPDPPPVLH